MYEKSHNMPEHDAPTNPDRRRIVVAGATALATAAITVPGIPTALKEHRRYRAQQRAAERAYISKTSLKQENNNATSTNVPEHKESPPGFRTVAWHIMHDQPFPENGMALAQAAHDAQLHHLQSYHERNERNDFLDGALRITQSRPEEIAKAFAKNGFSAKIAFGLPLQESFFRTGIASRSNALGPYQIKLRTALGVLKNTPQLRHSLLGIKTDDLTALHDRALRKTIMRKLLDDPVFSAQIAAALLREEYARHGDVALAVTAYNTGASLALPQEERRDITYERFTTLMMQKIAETKEHVFTKEAHYVIAPGDTLSGLARKFPRYDKNDLLAMVGGSAALRAGARTAIPLPRNILTKKVLRAAHRYIEPLEYAPKVMAASDVLAQTQNFAHLVATPKTTTS